MNTCPTSVESERDTVLVNREANHEFTMVTEFAVSRGGCLDMGMPLEVRNPDPAWDENNYLPCVEKLPIF